MDGYSAVKCEDKTTAKASCEVNHNKTTGGEDGLELPRVNARPIRNYTTEVIELSNDGRVEIVASRPFGRQVTSRRKKDEVRITLDHEDTIHVVVAAEGNNSDPNIFQRCGARIPHGPAVLDAVVSGLVFIYAFLLTLLVAHVRENWEYLSIVILWFFYVILRINTYNKRGPGASAFGRKVWHFTGMSFTIIFMYATLVVVFPMLIRDAFYESTTTNSDVGLIMPSLKASAGFTLIGMAARRSFHCGKILGHMDIINSILLDNVDIFNLVETLSVMDGDSPMIPKGSVMEICILVACEVAFLIIALEALMPYSLLVLDRKNVGVLKHNVSIQESKEQAIVMMYPYSLLVLNVPFLVIRLVLFAKYNTFQLGYVIKNVTSILFGSITLIRARNSLKRKQVKKRWPEFASTGFQQRRVSV